MASGADAAAHQVASRPGTGSPSAQCPPRPPLPAAGVKPGRLLLEEHGLPLPWRNTNTHQRSLEIHARSPGREKRGGNGGGSRGHGPQARQTGTEPSSSAGSQQPPSPRLHPQPQQTALAPPEYQGPLRAQHPIWVQAARQPQPRQNRAVPMGLRATQGTEGSRNVPAPLAAIAADPESTLLQAACKHMKKQSRPPKRAVAGRGLAARDAEAALADAADEDAGARSAGCTGRPGGQRDTGRAAPAAAWQRRAALPRPPAPVKHHCMFSLRSVIRPWFLL